MKLSNTKLIYLLLLIGIVQMDAQRLDKLGCGYEGISPWFENYQNNKAAYQFEKSDDLLWVPMTIHILGDDEGNGYFPTQTLFASVCQLNEDFATAEMQFYIEGDINYINNTAWYDHEGFGAGQTMMRTNNVANTVNCYIVQNPAGNCGYYAPGGNAVALSKSCNGPNDHTWAHELGHFFSLPHTFVGWEGTDYAGSIPGGNRRGVENVARTNCSSTADRFCDTPADYLSFRWTCNGQGFSNIRQTDPTGEDFLSDGTLFMSYANDACMTRFSAEQMEAMNANIRFDRRELLTTPTILGEITETVAAITPKEGETVMFDEAELTWSEAENATGYYVRVSRLPTLSGLFVFEGFVYDTTLSLPALDIGKTYYWRVQPFNNFSFCTNVSVRASFKAAATTSSVDIDALNFSVFPNPINTDEAIWIEGLENNQDFQWSIYDIYGRTTAQGNSTQSSIELNGIPKGTYLLSITSKNKGGTQKLIIR